MVTALRAAGALRALSGFLTLFLAFYIQSTETGTAAAVALGGLVAAAAGGSVAGTALGARMTLSRPDPVLLTCIGGVAVVALVAALSFSLSTAILVAAAAGVANALGKLCLDAIIQREVPDALRASAFARSETLLQLAWVAGGGLGIALPPNGPLGFGVVAGLLVVAVRGDRGGPAPVAAAAVPAPGRPAGAAGGGARRVAGWSGSWWSPRCRRRWRPCSPGGPARPVRLGPYEAVVAGGLTAVAGGVGPARAAAAAGTGLALERFDLVLSAGVGGGFAGRARPGDLVLADRVVHADLGADSPDGFLPVDRLGFGAAEAALDAGLVARAAGWTGALVGPIVTVSTVTGTAARAAQLAATHRPAAEAMEGAGVLAAAQAHGVPFLELRAISNPVGRRDRAGWDLPGALARLGPAVRALAAALAEQPRRRPDVRGEGGAVAGALAVSQRHVRLPRLEPRPDRRRAAGRGHLRGRRRHQRRRRARGVRRGQGVVRGASLAARATTRCCPPAARSAAAAARWSSRAGRTRRGRGDRGRARRPHHRLPALPAVVGRRAAGAGGGACRSRRSCRRSAPARYDAGLVIHEARFTYQRYGLTCAADLGTWWEAETGLPIPLGAILARRRLDTGRLAAVVRESVERAWADPVASAGYVARHASEMDPRVQRQHIELYVNRFTADLGEEGAAAVRTLLAPGDCGRIHPTVCAAGLNSP